MTGLDKIVSTFSQARHERRAALMPYFTLGYPSIELTVPILQALVEGGADLIELGVPFSDPLADGPTIQNSTQVALKNGMTVAGSLELVREIRVSGVTLPLLLMGYINPILTYGIERYVQGVNQAGADGMIIPDLPLEEAEKVESLCQKHKLALVYLATPDSPADRVEKLARHTTGFLYLVSLNGVTGVRDALSPGLEDFIQRARQVARTPLAVGFGIATPQQAALVGKLADGVIIGSALIDAVGKSSQPVEAAFAFTKEIRIALSSCQETTSEIKWDN
jgi:tryptophan synthase alpha chain